MLLLLRWYCFPSSLLLFIGFLHYLCHLSHIIMLRIYFLRILVTRSLRYTTLLFVRSLMKSLAYTVFCIRPRFRASTTTCTFSYSSAHHRWNKLADLSIEQVIQSASQICLSPGVSVRLNCSCFRCVQMRIDHVLGCTSQCSSLQNVSLQEGHAPNLAPRSKVHITAQLCWCQAPQGPLPRDGRFCLVSQGAANTACVWTCLTDVTVLAGPLLSS